MVFRNLLGSHYSFSRIRFLDTGFGIKINYICCEYCKRRNVPFGTSSMVFGILIAALFLSTFVLVINRFRSNIYGRQGYLTMTLPVNSHQLILSKLVASLVWYFLAGITALLAIGIVISFVLMSTNELLILNCNTCFSKLISVYSSHMLLVH